MSNYTIKEIGRLGLSYKTFIDKISRDKNNKIHFETRRGELKDGLDIYIWAEDFSHRWSIASFKLDEKEGYFKLHEIGDRLANPDIDYLALKELVILGHDMLMRTEEILD